MMREGFKLEPWGLEWNEKLFSIASSIAVVLSAWCVGKQVKVMKDDYLKKNEKEEFTKSFELTNYYINEILPSMEAILIVFTKIKFTDIVKKDENYDLVHFDKSEFHSIFTIDEQKKIFQLLHSDVDRTTLFIALEKCNPYTSCDLHIKCNQYVSCVAKPGDKVSADKAAKNFDMCLNEEFKQIITRTLNKLEYFSMYFDTNLAEDEVVYASLHQTFLYLVQVLYPRIAVTNGAASQKYYTHTINLYKKWDERNKKNKEKEKKILEEVRSSDCSRRIKKCK